MKDKSMLFFMAVYMIVGGVAGVQGARLMDEYGLLAGMALIFVIFLAAMLLSIVLHEGGHLAFGLATGYRFRSFRILNLMLKKENGKFRLCSYSLAGTGGQCLLDPPDLVDGRMPCFWYNVGGVLVNVIVTVLSACISQAVSGSAARVFWICLALVNLGIAITNGIPIRSVVANDGYNALSLGKNPAEMRALWLQLRCNACISDGQRLRDLPAEWFQMPEGEELKNPLCAAVAYLCCCRKMDELPEGADTAAAKAHLTLVLELLQRLLEADSALAGVHRSLLTCDVISIRLLLGEANSTLDSLRTKELQKVIKAMATFPSILRMQYITAVLGEKDSEKAKKTQAAFEKMSRSYPNPCELEAERGLMRLCDAIAAEQ